MGFKAVYNCDICRDTKKPHNLKGIYFKGMVEFELREAASTQGVHICNECLLRLEKQLTQPKDG